MTILDRNLSLLEKTSPDAVRRIRSTPARPDVEFVETPEGPSVVAGGRALASKRRPMTEARRQAETIDLKGAGGVVVLGFGAGHHAAAVGEKMRRTGVVIAFEPDVGLLRAVLERIDITGWMGETNFVLLTEPDDSTVITNSIRGVEGLLAIGVKFLEPASARVRCGPELDRFSETFANVMRTVRTVVTTTLMQVETTLRNLFMNIDHYAAGVGIGDLAGAARGKPAIVVSAGPSLKRNLDLLADPSVRDRFVVIAVQTALKPLLERGVRPHFVTALDYHEISTRFYEGLTEDDVRGVTLVAEPKANPAILEAFPGTVRLVANDVLDQLLGDDLAPSPGEHRGIEPGATVAHLAYSLARRLGCDPVILTGQDLGFTDGQYYGAGAAIHNVWSSELNPFRTLEMFEWERVVRQRPHLRRAEDLDGRPIYSDEQMSSYLLQFDQEFQRDSLNGLVTIDASGGGVRKRYTEVLPLREALDRFGGDTFSLPEPGNVALRTNARVKERVGAVRRDVYTIGESSRKTAGLLRDMLEHQQDQAHVNRLIGQVNAVRDEVTALRPAWELVNQLNQTGTLNRFKSDRALDLDEPGDGMERQRRQIERDITNVTWIGDASDQLGRMLDDCVRCLDGAPKITRDPAPPKQLTQIDGVRDAKPRVAAVIPVDPDRGGLGTPRDLAEPIVNGQNPLQLTLRRLSSANSLDEIVLLAEEPDHVRAIAGDALGKNVTIVRTKGTPMGERGRAVASARAFSPACWRGGIAGLTVFDETFAPEPTSRVLTERRLDAAVLIGADWALVDPRLIDAVIERHVEDPKKNTVVFTPGAPGLGVCLVSAELVRDLARQLNTAGPFATIGGLLGYVPAMPRHDPIARSWCVGVHPAVRDLALRCISDTMPARDAIASLFTEHDLSDLDAEHVARRLDTELFAQPGPTHVTLELCTGRRVCPKWATPRERPVLSPDAAARIFEQLASMRGDIALTLGGAGDPLMHPRLHEIVRTAQAAGIASVHVRTDLLGTTEDAAALLDSGADVLSVDLYATTRETYRSVTGADLFERATANTAALLETRKTRPALGGLPTPWIVPRITRCDESLGEIEAFYDRWIMHSGAAVIDPYPGSGRFEALPLPRSVQNRFARENLIILSDATVMNTDNTVIGNAASRGLAEIWRESRNTRDADMLEPAA